jgi:coproporphyrinogen III oxidase-like Fe-S oxidoreductase
MMGLRLREGLDLSRFEGVFSELKELFKKEQVFENIELNGNVARATRQGERVLDSVLQRLFTEMEKIRPALLDSASFDPKF